MSDYDPVFAALLDRSHLPPDTCLDRYRKAELQKIAETWLALAKANLADTEYALSQDLRTSDLKAIIRRLSRATSPL
jgi:hypothetical protein